MLSTVVSPQLIPFFFKKPFLQQAVVCGRRNFYSRKPNNWDFSFFSFQKGTNVSKVGIFHKQNCKIEAVLKENFSYFDEIEMFHSDFDFKTTSDK